MKLDDMSGEFLKAIRILRREPGFSAAAILLLALGIGANTVVFSALWAAVLRPTPYPASERLVLPKIAWTPSESTDTTLITWSWPKYEVYREGIAPLTDGISGYAVRTVSLTAPGDPMRVQAELVENEYFELLGARPLIGRTFSESEADVRAPSSLVVISHDVWSGRFGSDPEVLGRTIELQGQSFSIIGVMPTGFDGITGLAEIWLPIGDGIALIRPSYLEAVNSHWIHAIARRRTEVSFEAFQATTRRIGDEVFQIHGALQPGERMGADAVPLSRAFVNSAARASTWILSAGAVLLLLITVANLASLHIARSAARRRDAAIRLALGSSGRRLVSGVVIESVTLAGIAGLLSLVLALWGTSLLRLAWPESFLRSAEGLEVVRVDGMGVDGVALLFALGLTLSTGVLLGLLPAVRHGRYDLAGALRSHGQLDRSGARGGSVGRAALVSVQAALALVLVVGAGLMARTLHGLQTVDGGFGAEGLVTFRYALSTDGPFAETPSAFHRALLDRLSALPGVEGAAVASVPPYSGGHNFVTSVLEIDGEAYDGERGSRIGIQVVGPSFFEVLHIDVLRGRGLTPQDGDGAPLAVVVSQAAEAEIFDGDAVGRSMATGMGGDRAEVVGVVADVRYEAPAQAQLPVAYYSMEQLAERDVAVIVRASRDVTSVIPEVRQVMAELDPMMPIFEVSTIDDLAASASGDARILTGLLGTFAALALLLAGTGLYGVVAYTMSSRRREMAVRMALGASRLHVDGMALRQGLGAAGIGVAGGLVGAWTGTRLLEGFLFELSPRDPLTFLLAAGAILLVATIASWVPTFRVTRVDPIETLRLD